MFLNVDNVGAERMCSGRLFLATGPVTQNVRLPSCSLVLGTNRSSRLCVGDQMPHSSFANILPNPSSAAVQPDTLSAVFQPINPLAISQAPLAVSRASPGKVSRQFTFPVKYCTL